MDILSKFLTVVLFLNCLFLILLVLVQLPKKEAGLGTAFGGGTTDALFGAGAGNVLTKLTKWNAVLFLVLCLFLSLPFVHSKGSAEGEGGGAPGPAKGGEPAPGTQPGPANTNETIIPSPVQPGPIDTNTPITGTDNANSTNSPTPVQPETSETLEAPEGEGTEKKDEE